MIVAIAAFYQRCLRPFTINAIRDESRCISATVEPLKKIAPVGQAEAHFPHEVQVAAVPQGWFRSVIMRTPVPRPATSQVCTPSTSSQTRTQRVQSTQRL